MRTLSQIRQVCDHKTCRVRSHRGRNGFSHCKNGSCSITQLLSRPKVSKSLCVISQKPFLYSVRTLSSGASRNLSICGIPEDARRTHLCLSRACRSVHSNSSDSKLRVQVSCLVLLHGGWYLGKGRVQGSRPNNVCVTGSNVPLSEPHS